MKTLAYSTLASFAGLSMLLCGCGGGATESPTITAKPMRAKQVAETKTGTKKGNGTKAATGGTGDLVGVIKFDGAAPSIGKPTGFDPSDAKTDKYCVGVAGQITDESLIVDPASKGLKNVVVFLLKKPKGYSEPPPEKAVIFDQKNCVFVPHVLPVRTGQTMTLTNSDMTNHNTHTYPVRNKGYSNALAYGKTDTIVYSSPETIPVRVGCDFHGWMSAFHVPLDHHFVDVTDKDGKFSIKGLPAGVHRFRIWHEKKGYLEKEYEIEIKPGENKLDLSYKAATFANYVGPKPKTIILSSLK